MIIRWRTRTHTKREAISNRSTNTYDAVWPYALRQGELHSPHNEYVTSSNKGRICDFSNKDYEVSFVAFGAFPDHKRRNQSSDQGTNFSLQNF